METMTDFIFLGSKITANGNWSHKIKRCLLFGRKAMTNLDIILKCRNITLPTMVHTVKAMVFKVVMYRYVHDMYIVMYSLKEGWSPKNLCFWTVVLEKTLESPLDCKEIQPVNPKGNQSWIFSGRTDAEAEAPICWSSDAKSWLTGKDPDVGKTEGRRRRGQQRLRWLDGLTDSMDWVWRDSRSWWWTGKPGVL